MSCALHSNATSPKSVGRAAPRGTRSSGRGSSAAARRKPTSRRPTNRGCTRDSDASMVIADTGFWLALANRRDEFHENAMQALDALGSERLILTWPVMTETCYLLLDRL